MANDGKNPKGPKIVKTARIRKPNENVAAKTRANTKAGKEATNASGPTSVMDMEDHVKSKVVKLADPLFVVSKENFRKKGA